MSKPTGLLLAAGPVSGDQVTAALHDQGGPAWDETVFRILSGVDPGSLASTKPAPGEGTAISFASSGWWLRNIDDLASRLAEAAGCAVIALFECSTPAASGYHLVMSTGEVEREVILGDPRGWVRGVALLADRELEIETAPSLVAIGDAVHGRDPKGAHLAAMFNFVLDASDGAEFAALLEVRGAALVAGLPWRPDGICALGDEPPFKIRTLVLQTAIRLPGPPRWARAVRAVAIRTAEEATRADGWVCLVPEAGDSAAVYGTAVQVLQLAPLADGSALGVLHPRAAVRVGRLSGGVASVDVVPQDEQEDRVALGDALDVVVGRLRAHAMGIRYSARELRTSDDPASLLGWQLPVSVQQGQLYLAARGPVGRLRALAEILDKV
jgi:hypothetical protein